VPQPWRRIAGIVGNVHHRGLDMPPIPEMYIPHAQFLHFSPGVQARAMAVVVKTRTDPQALVSAVRGEIRKLDPEIPAAQVRTMDDVVASSTSDRRLNLALIGSFALLALLLAMIGVYGVMAYHVSQRRREIGVRLALGAAPADVRAGVIRQGMRMVLFGIAAGVAVAFPASRAVGQMLFEVKPADLTIFAAVLILLAASGVIACYIPALRAGRVDAVVALRAE